MKRLRYLVVGVVLTVAASVAIGGSTYPGRVEREFERFMNRHAPGAYEVHASRCVGEPSEQIDLWRIVQSKYGMHPLYENHHISYWHGYWFNYCKVVTRPDDTPLIAYWSVRRDRWCTMK